MIDIRQSVQWGQYLSQIGWNIEFAGKVQIFIRKVPLINRSLIKIQHPQNPLPFAEIEKIAKKHRVLFVLIEPDCQKYREEDFIQAGYQKSSMSLTHTATIHLNLRQTPEQLFASFSENARRNIKKAQKNNLQIKTVYLKDTQNDQEFKKFYQLLHSLTKLKKFYTPGYDEFYKKMLAFKKTSVLFFAYKKNQPLAVVWAAYFNKTLFYMHTGITEKGYQLLGNYLLVWEAVKEAQKMKLETFNFEGIYDPRFPRERKKWVNFSEFKKRFHGQIIEYPGPQIKFYSKIFKIFYLCSNLISR